MPIVSRVKVMSNLDIAERRLQDGRIELTLVAALLTFVSQFSPQCLANQL